MPIPLIQGSKVNPDSSHTKTVYPFNTYFKNGRMRTIPGLYLYARLNGIDRGGYYVNSEYLKGHFRIVHNRLVEVDQFGATTNVLETPIPGTDRVVFTASIDNLVFVADNKLFLFNHEQGLRQVSKFLAGSGANIGEVLDVIWIKQALIILVKTTVSDRLKADNKRLIRLYQGEVQQDDNFKPTRNAIDDTDPDRPVAIESETDFFILFNKSTITFYMDQIADPEFFSYLPAQSKQIKGGLVGRDAKARIAGTWAILSVNVPSREPNIYLVGTDLMAIGSAEIQAILKNYAEIELEKSVLESWQKDGIEFLMVHLPNHSFMWNSDNKLWTMLNSRDEHNRLVPYRGWNIVRDQRSNKIIAGDKYRDRLGVLDSETGSEFGLPITQVLYTEFQLFNMPIRHLVINGNFGEWPKGEQPLLKIQITQSGIVYDNILPVFLPDSHDYMQVISCRNIGFLRGYASFRIEVSSRHTFEIDQNLYINEEADAQVTAS